MRLATAQAGVCPALRMEQAKGSATERKSTKEPAMVKRFGTTTVTLSIPTDLKPFFEEINSNGYNRSFLMLKMVKILQVLYIGREEFPGGLHAACDELVAKVKLDAKARETRSTLSPVEN